MFQIFSISVLHRTIKDRIKEQRVTQKSAAINNMWPHWQSWSWNSQHNQDHDIWCSVLSAIFHNNTTYTMEVHPRYVSFCQLLTMPTLFFLASCKINDKRPVKNISSFTEHLSIIDPSKKIQVTKYSSSQLQIWETSYVRHFHSDYFSSYRNQKHNFNAYLYRIKT